MEHCAQKLIFFYQWNFLKPLLFYLNGDLRYTFHILCQCNPCNLEIYTWFFSRRELANAQPGLFVHPLENMLYIASVLLSLNSFFQVSTWSIPFKVSELATTHIQFATVLNFDCENSSHCFIFKVKTRLYNSHAFIMLKSCK